MSNYVVTNIRLPEEDYLKLKAEAARKRTSLSAVIRERVSEKSGSAGYAKKLLSLKTEWFSADEYSERRAKINERTQRYTW